MSAAQTRWSTTPIVHAAIATYMAEHQLRATTIHLPRIHGQRIEIWARDIDVSGWLAAGARLGEQTVRETTVDRTDVHLTAPLEVDTPLGTVTIELHWLEERAHLQSVHA